MALGDVHLVGGGDPRQLRRGGRAVDGRCLGRGVDLENLVIKVAVVLFHHVDGHAPHGAHRMVVDAAVLALDLAQLVDEIEPPLVVLQPLAVRRLRRGIGGGDRVRGRRAGGPGRRRRGGRNLRGRVGLGSGRRGRGEAQQRRRRQGEGQDQRERVRVMRVRSSGQRSPPWHSGVGALLHTELAATASRCGLGRSQAGTSDLVDEGDFEPAEQPEARA